MNKKGLKEAIASKLREDNDLQLKLASSKKVNRSYGTIRRWAKENHEYLALPACLNMICAEYGITQKEALA